MGGQENDISFALFSNRPCCVATLKVEMAETLFGCSVGSRFKEILQVLLGKTDRTANSIALEAAFRDQFVNDPWRDVPLACDIFHGQHIRVSRRLAFIPKQASQGYVIAGRYLAASHCLHDCARISM